MVPALGQPQQFCRGHLDQCQHLPAFGDENVFSHNPKSAPKPHAIEPLEPTLDREMVTKLGGAALIDFGPNDDWVSLRGCHFCQPQSKLFGQESARDFDETQIGDVMNDPTAIGIEKHHLHFRANTG